MQDETREQQTDRTDGPSAQSEPMLDQSREREIGASRRDDQERASRAPLPGRFGADELDESLSARGNDEHGEIF